MSCPRKSVLLKSAVDLGMILERLQRVRRAAKRIRHSGNAETTDVMTVFCQMKGERVEQDFARLFKYKDVKDEFNGCSCVSKPRQK